MRSRRRRPVGAEAVAEWCDSLSRRVRSGSTLRTAVATEVPSDDALASATEPLRLAIERGRPLANATDDLSGDALDRRPLAMVCSVVASVAEVGGPAGPPLDRVASAIRLRAADRQERDAHSAQARLSAHVLTVVPLGVLAVLVATDAHVRRIAATPVGAGCIGAGLALNVAGWCWMRRITRTNP